MGFGVGAVDVSRAKEDLFCVKEKDSRGEEGVYIFV